MKAARILIALGFMLFALNLVAFFDLEHRARAIEAQEILLSAALDNAREILQQGPPPRGMRVIGIYATDYGDQGTLDEFSSIGTWDGKTFSHTYIEDGQAYVYAISHDPPALWVPYPSKERK